MISGRLLSRENIYTFIDESSKTSSVSEVTKFFFFSEEIAVLLLLPVSQPFQICEGAWNNYHFFFLLNIKYTAAWLLWIATLFYDLGTLCVAASEMTKKVVGHSIFMEDLKTALNIPVLPVGLPTNFYAVP